MKNSTLEINGKNMTAMELLRTIKMHGFMDENGVIDQVMITNCYITECKQQLFPPITFVAGNKRKLLGFTFISSDTYSLFFGHEMRNVQLIGNTFKN